ncbi:MAG: DUF2142 domain-containing protein [Conexibacter sp.]
MEFLTARREAARPLLRPLPDDDRRSGRDPRALACAALALLLLCGALAVTLAHGGARRSGTDGVWALGQIPIAAGSTVCQAGELLPAGTATIQLAGVATRPPIVSVRQDGQVLARAAARPDARRQVLEAAIPQPRHDRPNVEVCMHATGQTTLFGGTPPPHLSPLTVAGNPLGVSMAVNYFEPGHRSWWAYAPTVAAHACARHGGWDPCWNVWVIAALLAASLALTVRLVLRTLVGNGVVRRTVLTVAGIAALNAAAWSLITPPFQVPDEVAHVAYAQTLAETGAPPADPRAIVVSPEESAAMVDTRFGDMLSRTLHTAAWAAGSHPAPVAGESRPLDRHPAVPQGGGEPEPPLYYALESLPYRAASSASLLDRMAAMRLLSATLAGVTAALCFLFVRECVPGRRWAWTVGGLGVAFAPMLGFISGGVNPDALLYALSAALFLALARAWRRGVTPRLVAAIGVLIAAGMLTKVNFYGLVPGALLGLALAARRATGAWNRRVALLCGGVAALAATLFLAGVGVQVGIWHRPFAVGRAATAASHVGLWGHLGYVWQVFLPRLPFQAPTTLTRPGYEQLFKTFVGAFGWVVVWLPAWAYRVALAAGVVIGLSTLRMLHAEPRELRWRRPELLGYAAMVGVLLLMIGLSADLRRDILHIVQGRYLLPLLPLFALFLTLGARGAGERWGRAFGVAIVAGAIGWSVLGQLMTIAFFYS